MSRLNYNNRNLLKPHQKYTKTTKKSIDIGVTMQQQQKHVNFASAQSSIISNNGNSYLLEHNSSDILLLMSNGMTKPTKVI